MDPLLVISRACKGDSSGVNQDGESGGDGC